MKSRARSKASTSTGTDQRGASDELGKVPVHVTPNGGRYVLGKDLVRSRGFREAIESMKRIEASSKKNDGSAR